jgi:hypothetical protein
MLPHLVQPAMDKLQRLGGGKGIKGSYVFSVMFTVIFDEKTEVSAALGYL